MDIYALASPREGSSQCLRLRNRLTTHIPRLRLRPAPAPRDPAPASRPASPADSRREDTRA